MPDICKRNLEATRCTARYSIGWRLQIYVINMEGIPIDLRNKANYVYYFISSTNRWANRKNESND